MDETGLPNTFIMLESSGCFFTFETESYGSWIVFLLFVYVIVSNINNFNVSIAQKFIIEYNDLMHFKNLQFENMKNPNQAKLYYNIYKIFELYYLHFRYLHLLNKNWFKYICYHQAYHAHNSFLFLYPDFASVCFSIYWLLFPVIGSPRERFSSAL